MEGCRGGSMVQQQALHHLCRMWGSHAAAAAAAFASSPNKVLLPLYNSSRGASGFPPQLRSLRKLAIQSACLDISARSLLASSHRALQASLSYHHNSEASSSIQHPQRPPHSVFWLASRVHREFGGIGRAYASGSSNGKADGEGIDTSPDRLQDGVFDEGSAEGGSSGNGMAISRPLDQRIVPVELHKEASDSYLAYAMSVILGRALPDVRDGLKPVHRRILYAMHELGLTSKRPFKKCARVVGEVLGKFHPHGDTAVYDALVRLSQNFSLRSPLINGHGNFGSLDGDPAAAMRYTECRLEALSEAMLLSDLELNTVDFVPNFDGSQQEPLVLPSRLPNILLNGASGIAVGMATNIPPHNLGEVVDALCALIRNPNATVQELMEHLPGPDFPTGGQILGSAGILAAYRTGRGQLTVRGMAAIEETDTRGSRSAIVITEIPYNTNKAALVAKIADLVNDKTLEGVSDVRDESDRSGMRIVVEVKRGSMPSVVLNNLYKHTTLQSRYSCNMVGFLQMWSRQICMCKYVQMLFLVTLVPSPQSMSILDKEPQIMGIKDFLQHFLDFRCSVIERRARFELKRAEDRDHLVQGILKGLDNLDQVVKIIRHAKDSAQASQSLQQGFALSSIQAEALLALPLRRLTGLERHKLVEEHNALGSQISDLKHLLTSKQRIFQVVEKEALAIKKEFSTPRRTLLEQDNDGQISDIDVIPNDETLVMLSAKGYIKRMQPDTFSAQRRGTLGKSGGKMRTNDAMSDFFVCHNHDYVLFFSERGIVYSIRAYRIPECSRTAAGNPVLQILPIPPGERITSVLPVSKFVEDQYLVMLTEKGYIKRTTLASFSAIRSQGIVAIQLVPGDELKWVRQAAEHDTVLIGSQLGLVVRIACDFERFRVLKRAARGVRAMRLKPGDKLAAMDILPASLLQALEMRHVQAPWLLLVSVNGYGKRVPISSFPSQALNRVGVIGCKFQQGDGLASLFVVGSTVSAADGESEEQIVLGSQGGIFNRLRVRDVSIQGRMGRGVKLMRLEAGDKLNTVSIVTNTELDEHLLTKDLDLIAA
ncbi:hypothetical protein O6H91_14G038200 [Diphasiastrum complanatum]|uniref:Uncharacterized protein n=1 Tax=Diphasiastrum complanatum TaxID=34168 RepID=A0ACC2BNI7_DIPCM|nr:hypothetical protein O6H91_14G038200 [Diphasiastrum complanatum]